MLVEREWPHSRSNHTAILPVEDFKGALLILVIQGTTLRLCLRKIHLPSAVRGRYFVAMIPSLGFDQ